MVVNQVYSPNLFTKALQPAPAIVMGPVLKFFTAVNYKYL
jgi:hypothetical protein